MNSEYRERENVNLEKPATFTRKLDMMALRNEILYNNINAINKLIEKVDPSELNYFINYMHTPLSLASYSGHMEVVQLLLSAGAHPNTVSLDNKTPMYWAAVQGHIKVVELLLSSGAHPNIANKVKETPLYWASTRGFTEIVKLLLSAGADPNIANEYNETPLRKATRGPIEVIKLLLSYGADPNIAGTDNITALYQAAYFGDTEAAELLLFAGANPNIPDLEDEYLPYLWQEKIKKTISIIRNWKGLDPNEVLDNGRTILMDLIIKGYYSAFQQLLPQVKNIDIQDEEGNTALHYTLMYKRRKMFQDLLEKHAIMDIANKYDKVPIDYAIETLIEDKDDTYIRDLYRASREFLYGSILYREARSRFITASKKKDEDPLLIPPESLDDKTLKDLANALSLFKEEAWDLSELHEEIHKIQSVLRPLLPDEREKYLEDLFVKNIVNAYYLKYHVE